MGFTERFKKALKEFVDMDWRALQRVETINREASTHPVQSTTHLRKWKSWDFCLSFDYSAHPTLVITRVINGESLPLVTINPAEGTIHFAGLLRGMHPNTETGIREVYKDILRVIGLEDDISFMDADFEWSIHRLREDWQRWAVE